MSSILDHVPQTGEEIWLEMMSPTVMIGEMKQIAEFEDKDLQAYASKSGEGSLYLYCTFDNIVYEDCMASGADDVSDFLLDVIDNATDFSVAEYSEIEDWLFGISDREEPEVIEEDFEDDGYDYYDKYYNRYGYGGYYNNLYSKAAEPKVKEESLPGFLKIKMIES